MAGRPGTRPHVGAPPRSLALADLNAQRERLLLDPVSPQRAAALLKIRRQLRRMSMRSERAGA